MSARRLLTTTVLAAATLTLTLTACDPATPSAPASTAAAPVVTASPVTAPSTPTSATTPATTPKPEKTSTKPTAKPSSSTPAADCTANAQHPGHKVINATVAWGSPDRIGANATRFVCGPDVDNDGYYEAVSPNSEYRFAAGAQAVLIGPGAKGIESKPVPLSRLLQQINTCTSHSNAPGSEYGCYGNMYDITLDPSGKITTITELFHP
ncbi:hypothetical protein ABT095_16245 [Kitasatospora sp. NPDC002227]|uniref:hypothetical protein n=1 Tax=Kitasatospora sp. NPDC002227 TaxID=3154773 RepID=UPI00331DE011